MGVTEFATVRLKPDVSLKDTKSQQALKQIRDVLETSSGYKFCYAQNEDDNSILYILGGWESISYHRDKFIPSESNQKLLELVENLLTVESMYHIDIDPTSLSLQKKSPYLSISQYFIYKDKYTEFSDAIEKSLSQLKHLTDKVMGGYSKDNPNVQKYIEYVLFVSWEGSSRKGEYGTLPGYDSKDEYKSMLSRFNVIHATILDI